MKAMILTTFLVIGGLSANAQNGRSAAPRSVSPRSSGGYPAVSYTGARISTGSRYAGGYHSGGSYYHHPHHSGSSIHYSFSFGAYPYAYWPGYSVSYAYPGYSYYPAYAYYPGYYPYAYPGYTYYPAYAPAYTYTRPNYAVTGSLLGAGIGAIIGNNVHHQTWEGAAIGAGAGLLLGGLAESGARARERAAFAPAPVAYVQPNYIQNAPTVNNAPTVEPAPQMQNNNYAPAGSSGGANSLFGR